MRTIIRASGNLNFSYSPFGSPNTTTERWSFIGQEQDKETVGLNELDYRKYQSETGSFLRHDPLWASYPEQSPFGYCYNSPLVWSDPTGLDNEKVVQCQKVVCYADRYEPDYGDGYATYCSYIRWLYSRGGGSTASSASNPGNGWSGGGGGSNNKEYGVSSSSGSTNQSVALPTFSYPPYRIEQSEADRRLQVTNQAVDDLEVFFTGLFTAPLITELLTEAGVLAWTTLTESVGLAQANPEVRQREALVLETSVKQVMGETYQAIDEVSVSIKNSELLTSLNATSQGDWVKVYEAGIQNGNKIETHYFRNNTTGEVFNVLTRYNYWHQNRFKK